MVIALAISLIGTYVCLLLRTLEKDIVSVSTCPSCIMFGKIFFYMRTMYFDISSVVEFQRWWVLKSKIFGQEATYLMEILLRESFDELRFIS